MHAYRKIYLALPARDGLLKIYLTIHWSQNHASSSFAAGTDREARFAGRSRPRRLSRLGPAFWTRRPGGAGGGGLPFGRFVGDGDLRLIVLSLLADGPRHGYDLIKALEERSNGFYSPSPGVIYPTLTFLEEAGHAASTAEGNKKVFAITEAGRAYLDENREAADAILARIEWIGDRLAQARNWFEGARGGRARDRDMPDVIPELNEARRALKSALAAKLGASADEQRRIAELLRKAASEIEELRPEGPDDIDLVDADGVQPSSIERFFAASTARVRSGCRPSSAISTDSAAAVVPPGEVTFLRSTAGESGLAASSAPEPATVCRARSSARSSGQAGLARRFGEAFGEQEDIGRARARHGGHRIDQRFVVDPGELADRIEKLLDDRALGFA